MDSASSSSSSPTLLVFSIPEGMALNRVGLKKTLLERSHAGFQCEIDKTKRQVSVSGSEAQLKDAKNHFQQLFGQLTTAALTAATSTNSQHCNRSFAALSANSSSYWRFVATRGPVGDVDTQAFPYELVRASGDRSPASAPTRMNNLKPPRRRPNDNRSECRFLMAFDDQYLAREAATLNKIVIEDQHRGTLKLKAVFGRKLFGLDSVDSKATYDVDTLRDLSRTYQLGHSNWSNVCDSDGPELARLLLKLQNAKAELGIEAYKEDLSVWLRLVNDKVKITFSRDLGGDEEEKKWVYNSTKRPPGARFVYDISLADRVNFRTRAYNKSQRLSDEDVKAQELRAMVVVHEPETGDDIFSSKVEIVESESASLLWVTIKRVTKVPFGGLVFKMKQLGDELQLEAQLQEADKSSGAALSDKFKWLVEKLQAILMETSGSLADEDKSAAGEAKKE